MEEELDELASPVVNSGDDFTETKHLLYGLDLEGQQYVFAGLPSYHRTNCLLGINCSLCLR